MLQFDPSQAVLLLSLLSVGMALSILSYTSLAARAPLLSAYLNLAGVALALLLMSRAMIPTFTDPDWHSSLCCSSRSQCSSVRWTVCTG